ncbi:hypothetical protein GEMRC1_002594 [Eukaryota sp. GEM-RC1]
MSDSVVIGDESFSYKSLYLDTLKAEDLAQRQLNYVHNPLKNSDIDLSCPKFRHNRFLRDNISVGDVDRSCPKVLHPTKSKNAPYLYYRNDDIEKSRPPDNKPSNRCTNPVDPVYPLPSYVERPITPPKFLRDSLNVTDIEGTVPVQPKPDNTHDYLYYYDVHKASTAPKLFTDPRDILNVKDINHVEYKTLPPRFSNPVEPTYILLDGTKVADDPLCHPKPAPSALPRFNLTVNDIDGAKSGWLPPAHERSGKHLPMIIKNRDVFKVDGIQKPKECCFLTLFQEFSNSISTS